MICVKNERAWVSISTSLNGFIPKEFKKKFSRNGSVVNSRIIKSKSNFIKALAPMCDITVSFSHGVF